MNSLRFLLVHRNPKQSEEIMFRLASANHTVLPINGLQEAADALTVERFDAVLMDPTFQASANYGGAGGHSFGLEEFSALLRRMENSQKSGCRVPVIALAAEGPLNGDHSASNLLNLNDHRSDDLGTLNGWVDAVLPEPVDPIALSAAVSKLAHAVSKAPTSNAAAETDSMVILDPEKFREQVGFDTELLLEIIDLFLEERQRQEPEMCRAFATGDFESLSRVAHTIKGSLGSLHAQRARSHAQDLELGAKQHDRAVCERSLAGLLRDLVDLEPELLALKHVWG